MPVSDDKDYQEWDTEIVDGVLAVLVPIYKGDGQAREHIWAPARLFGSRQQLRPRVYDATMAYKWAPEFGAYIPWKSTPAAKRDAAISGFADDTVHAGIWMTGLVVTFFGTLFGIQFGAWLFRSPPSVYDTNPMPTDGYNYGAGVVVGIVFFVALLSLTRLLARKFRGA